MARVTVEDCIEIVSNRFELVMIASKRAREIAAGASITVPRDNDKNPVVALREIALKTVGVDDLRETIIKGMQRIHHMDDREEDLDEELDQDYAPPFEASAADLLAGDDDDLDEEDLEEEELDEEEPEAEAT